MYFWIVEIENLLSLYQNGIMMNNHLTLTAPCGIDCFNCSLYEKNLTEAMKERMAQAYNLDPKTLACKGCREQKGCTILPSKCDTLECINEHNVTFCFECDEFPCSKLQPLKEGADKFPHNFKVFNLCRIQRVGLEKWATEEASDIRKKYFEGKFAIGKGPVL